MADFIPKPYKKEPITLRIDVEKLDKIERLAAKNGMNRSEFINRCIDFALQPQAKESEPDVSP